MAEALKVRYESEFDHTLLDKVSKTPGGEKIKDCIQCGTCSGSCPVSHLMDYSPRQIIAMVRAGLRKEVLESNTIWWCLSCYMCTVRCPKEIKQTDIMYALKRIAMNEGAYSDTFRTPKLEKSFARILQRYGRNSESELVLRYNFKKNPFALLHDVPLAMRLLFHHRLPLLPKRIAEVKDLRKIIETAYSLGGV